MTLMPSFPWVISDLFHCPFAFQDLEPAPDVEFNVEETSVVSRAPEVSAKFSTGQFCASGVQRFLWQFHERQLPYYHWALFVIFTLVIRGFSCLRSYGHRPYSLRTFRSLNGNASENKLRNDIHVIWSTLWSLEPLQLVHCGIYVNELSGNIISSNGGWSS